MFYHENIQLLHIFLRFFVYLLKKISAKIGCILVFYVFAKFYWMIGIFMIFSVNNETGFTLVEMLITVSIMAIVVMIALPSFTSQLKRMEANMVANDIYVFLVNAKQEAMIYQNTLTVCMVDDRQNCVASQGKGLVSFIDKNDNHRFDAGVDNLRNRTGLRLRFGEIGFVVALKRSYIDFKPQTGTPIGFMGHIKYCPNDSNTANMFKVSFNKNGIIKVKTYKEEATGC